MKRIEVYAVGILLALVPAVFGLWGNASFSKDVPVRVPDQARATAAVASRTRGRWWQRTGPAGRRSSATTPGHGADDPATHDVNDDHGGDRSGDNGGDRSAGNGDDRTVATRGGSRGGGRGGADDPATHDVGDDHGGATGWRAPRWSRRHPRSPLGRRRRQRLRHAPVAAAAPARPVAARDKESGGHGSDD